MRAEEQILHDRINLPRLVKRLESSVQDGEWTGPAERDTWIKARCVLQSIRHARILLKNVELDQEPTSASSRHYQHVKTTLDRLETYMLTIEKQLAPPLQRPKPILPSIPPPAPKLSVPESSSAEDILIPTEERPLPPVSDVNDLMSGTSDVPQARRPENANTPVAPSGLFAAPPSSSNITATPTILQNSRALQEELSEQLALMASQLRRNATHFSFSLEKDKVVVGATQEKLDGNFDLVKKDRIRLRDFRGKSSGTTCLVIISIVIVLIAFVMMVFIIRVT